MIDRATKLIEKNRFAIARARKNQKFNPPAVV